MAQAPRITEYIGAGTYTGYLIGGYILVGEDVDRRPKVVTTYHEYPKAILFSDIALALL